MGEILPFKSPHNPKEGTFLATEAPPKVLEVFEKTQKQYHEPNDLGRFEAGVVTVSQESGTTTYAFDGILLTNTPAGIQKDRAILTVKTKNNEVIGSEFKTVEIEPPPRRPRFYPFF